MNIGIVVPHLGSSQIAFNSIQAVDKLIKSGYKDDIVLFFEQLVIPVITPRCATMCINELMSFKGVLITTTLNNTAMSLARNSRAKNKIMFYVYNLEWMRNQQTSYLTNYHIFNSVHKLIARSDQHAHAISNYSNRNIDMVLNEFNINEIIK